MIFYLFDRWGEQLGTILGVMRAVRSCEVNGVHTLSITTPSYLEKGQHVLYKDTCGKYREFVVQEITEDHDESDCVITTALCEDAICELNGDYLEDKRPSGTASAALVVALAPSRWKVGTVDVTGTQKMSFYHCSVREAICEIAESYKSEVSAEIVVSGGYVVERRVNILKRIGSDNGKRFAYRKDLASISRTVEIDDVISALYGFGKGLEQVDDTGEATGGYDRKLTFGRINGGLDYVADNTARDLWGRPDGKGGKAHVFGRVEFSDCEDMKELLSLTNAELTRRTTPRVSYTANVVNLAAGGFVVEGCSEGDSVQIVDTAFAKPLRLVGRVLKIDEDLLAPEETVITLGNIQPSIDSTLMDYGKSLKNFNDHASSWDGAASVSSSYINAVVKRLNEEFDAGGSYKYEAFEVGTIYSSVPLDANFKPTKTPASAYQLTGGGFRIASSVKANGEFEWRTFGSGSGFTADEITAGTIRGGSNFWNLETGDVLFKQGGIYDTAGKNGWNLGTGEFSLSANTTVGGSTVDAIANGAANSALSSANSHTDALDRELTQRGIFNRLTNNGQTQGIYLSNGLLYVNATYLKAGIISDAYGRNRWDLSNGSLTTTNMRANNITATGSLTSGSTYTAELIGGAFSGYYESKKVLEIASNLKFSNGQYGARITSPYYIVIRTPKLAVDTSPYGNGTICMTGSRNFIGKIDSTSSGQITWWTGTMTITNGLVMSMSNI